MPTLHLGVLDIPYSDAPSASPKASLAAAKRRSKIPPRTAAPSSKSTGDVADILESRYGIMEKFFELHTPIIADELAESARGALENLMMGAPGTISLTAEAESAIEADFKRALSLREFDGVISGVPTQAALDGVSHRFASPRGSRGSRPSFIDTGLYQMSFKTWVD